MTRVYVGGLPTDIRPDDVMYEFRRYEPLRVDLKQGFGFLEFREPRDADDAVHDMDGHRIGGRPIAVQFARGSQQRRDMTGGPRGGYDDRGGSRGGFGGPPGFGGMKKGSGYQVEVEGLDSRTSWQDLKDFARGAGNVQFADVFIRHGKKIGLIEYPSKEDVEAAVRKLDDTKLDGAVVRLFEVKREGGGGGGGGGGRGRSRSRSPPPRRDRSHSPRGRSRSRSRSPRGSRERGGRGGDRERERDERRDRSRSKSRSRSRSRSPRRDRSRSPAREPSASASASGSGSTGALAAPNNGSSTASEAAAPSSPAKE